MSDSFIDLTKRIKPMPEAISQKEIWELGKSLMDEQDRALLFFLYLTGARISEALQTQCRNIYVQDVILHDRQKIKAMAIDQITLKKRSGIPRRLIYLYPVGLDKLMLEEIVKFANKHSSDDNLLFDFGSITKNTKRARDVAYHRIHRLQYQVRAVAPSGKLILLPYFRLYLHYLRHCRATHLSQIYGYSANELKTFFNWSSDAMGGFYVHTNPVHLLEKMMPREIAQ